MNTNGMSHRRSFAISHSYTYSSTINPTKRSQRNPGSGRVLRFTQILWPDGGKLSKIGQPSFTWIGYVSEQKPFQQEMTRQIVTRRQDTHGRISLPPATSR